MAHGSRLTAHGEIAHSQDLTENSNLNPNSNLKKLSVIIPAYNTEKFLSKCVESVVNQTYKNIEIIIVNDGSTDLTPQICDELKDKYENIIVIHQENQGTGKTRGVGFNASTGDYITFVDADDYIDVTAYEKAIKVLEDNDCDMVEFGWCLVNLDGEILKEERKLNITINNSREAFLYFLTFSTLTSMCDKVYKRFMFDNIEWLDINMMEDYCILAQFFLKVKKFTTINDTFYYYVNNPLSTSRRSYTNKSKRDDAAKSRDFVAKLTEKYFPEFMPEILWRELGGLMLIFIDCSFSDCDDKQEILKETSKSMRKAYSRLMLELKKQNTSLKNRRGFNGLNRYTFKNRVRAWLFAYCPGLAALYLKIRLKIHALTGI